LDKAARKWRVPNNKLPTVSSDIPKDLRFFIDRVAEIVNSSGPDQFLTLSDLQKGVYNSAINDSGAIDDSSGDDVIIPVFCPPKATNLVATGGYEYIILDWDRPTYYGHAFTRVYRALGANALFSDAVAVTEVTGRAAVFSDYLGTGETATYWVQFVNINGEDCDVISDPATATTAINVEEVINALDGALTSSEFADDLSTFLDNAPDNYVVKLAGADGAAAGFGLASTPSLDGGGSVEFTFAVLADNFFITPPVDFNQSDTPSSAAQGDVWRDTTNPSSVVYKLYQGSEWVEFNPSPFIVRTTPITITNDDGKQVDVPAGVYIRDGYIQNGTITNAKIGTAAIDNAKIVDATIETGKIAYLDAGTIRTGNFESFDFTNEEGKAGFRLAMSTSPIFNEAGEFTGEFEFLSGTNQEDIEFILRGEGDINPALQLINGKVTINALNIREVLKSQNWPTSGFSFNVETGVFAFKDGTGNTIFTTNGFDGNAVEAAIQDTIDGLNAAIAINNAAIATKTPQTTFNSLLDTVNDATSGLATKASLVDLQGTNDSVATIDEQITDLNDDLLQVGNFDEAGDYTFDPSKLGEVLSTASTEEQLADYQFILEFSKAGLIDTYHQSDGFINLFAANAIFKDLYAEKAIFGTILANEVAANNGTIDNLLVNTVSIAGNAVTVPVSGNVTPNIGLTTSWQDVATTTQITWPNVDSRPSAAIVTATMNFLAINTDDPGTACRLRLVAVGPFSSAILQDAAVSTRRDYSQVVTISVKHDLSGKSSPYRYRLQARTDTSGDYRTGSGNIFALASKR
jgi:hypothetical protein